MAKAEQGKGVRVHYTGKLDDGTVFDSSYDRNEPLAFNLGSGMIIPGFEEAVEGMSEGDKQTVSIKAEKAYGPYFDELVQVVERANLPDGLDPQVGQQLQAQQPDGQNIILLVTDSNDKSITLDGNHPLAGKDLNFDLELVEVTEPFDLQQGGCQGGNCEECDDPKHEHGHEGCEGGNCN